LKTLSFKQSEKTLSLNNLKNFEFEQSETLKQSETLPAFNFVEGGIVPLGAALLTLELSFRRKQTNTWQ